MVVEVVNRVIFNQIFRLSIEYNTDTKLGHPITVANKGQHIKLE